MPNLRAEPTKNGKVRYRYKNVMTGRTKTVGGGNRTEAERIAKQANAIIAQKILDKEAELILSGAESGTGITWGRWCDEYMLIQQKRFELGKIKASTLKTIESRVKRVKKKFQQRKIHQLNTYDFTKYLKEDFLSRSKDGMAVMIRSTLIDICAEAISEGVLPSEKGNPAQFTKPIARQTKRSRLLLEVFKAALEWSQKNQQPFMWKAMLFALVTGQRREDIAKCRFDDIQMIEGIEYIGVIQGKTGTKVAIPLDLRLDSIGYSVRDIISLCRDRVVSRYLFHHNKSKGHCRAGDRVRTDTFSYLFADAIRSLGKSWGEFNPPTLHETRSLSGREYEKQNNKNELLALAGKPHSQIIDVQKLLGHKLESTTAIYKDSRGHDWVTVNVAES
ncbi:MAG: tyrosine-type recombinase/integrase [Neptuniibacter sp.]|nr:tyrosine-type recombinase/integrase [Neptuniibacter sp.]